MDIAILAGVARCSSFCWRDGGADTVADSFGWGGGGGGGGGGGAPLSGGGGGGAGAADPASEMAGSWADELVKGLELEGWLQSGDSNPDSSDRRSSELLGLLSSELVGRGRWARDLRYSDGLIREFPSPCAM